MEIEGRLMEGEIVERDKARATYESIVDAMRDPALLEWQEGQNFKLRVFPIEPQSEKRVILRYASPLTLTLDGWEYVYPSFAPDMQQSIASFKLRFDGRVIAEHENFEAGIDVIVPLPSNSVPRIVRETITAPDTRKNDQSVLAAARQRMVGNYTALRIEPDWSRLETKGATGRDTRATGLVVVVDTSRSTLESRALVGHTLEMTLRGLETRDRFALMSADIETRLHVDEPTPVSDASIARTLDALGAIDSDGASDIGAAFAQAAQLVAAMDESGHRAELLYIGDGSATWGITDIQELRTHIDAILPGITIHAAILGKGASQEDWRAITAEHAGRISSPRSESEARRFAFAVAHSNETPHIENLNISAGRDAVVYPSRLNSLYRGETLTLVMRSNAERPPETVVVEGRYEGRPFKQSIPVIAPSNTPLVAQRWARFDIQRMERTGATKSDIVQASKDYGVMSRHTSLLVLESEEAYRLHGIERRNTLAASHAAPLVTGGDLESIGAREASLSPDRIQPGDPEIRIPAPEDARQVVVIFPFGETKLAHFDSDARVWVTRFLIDKDTPDGKYMVIVQVTHADGHVESLELPYFVDTSAPRIDLSFEKHQNSFIITARQQVTSAEMVSLGMDQTGSLHGKKVDILSDAKRVELYLPDGRLMSLARKGPGVFRRRWRPIGASTVPVVIRVVVTDEALNQRVLQVRVHPDGRHEILDADAPVAN